MIVPGFFLIGSAGWPSDPLAIVLAAGVVVGVIAVLVWRYKRCPSNKLLVVYGQAGGGRSHRVLHGGGTFVWPLIQEWAYLSLEPVRVEIALKDPQNPYASAAVRASVAISVDPARAHTAAERFLRLPHSAIAEHAAPPLRTAVETAAAQTSIAEALRQPERFRQKVTSTAEDGLRQLGLEILEVKVERTSIQSGSKPDAVVLCVPPPPR